MTPSRARYVTACQQLLALGVVVIALVPATRVVTLDVVGTRPGAGAGPSIALPDTAEWEQVDQALPREPARDRQAQRQARRERSGERRALHRSDRVQAGLVGARHQDQRAR